MSEIFEIAKEITKTYMTGVDQGSRRSLVALSRVFDEIRKVKLMMIVPGKSDQDILDRLTEVERVVSHEIRRLKGLPF